MGCADAAKGTQRLTATNHDDGRRSAYAQRAEFAGLLAILAVALGLRLISLGTPLWYDEIVTLVEYVRLPTSELVTTYSSLNNHILYSLSAQASISLFGEHAWAVRLPAVVYGVASVAALWWLARHVVGRGQALLAAAMLACSPHHIWFSQNARGYTGLLLLTLLGTSLFLKGLRKPTPGTWLLYAVVTALAMYTHLSAIFMIAAQGIVYAGFLVASFRRERSADNVPSALLAEPRWLPLSGFVVAGVLTLACYAVLMPQMIEAFAAVTAKPASAGVVEWKSPVWTLLETLRSFAGERPELAIGLALAGTLSGIGALSLLCRQPALALLPLLHVPLVIAALYLASFRIWPRYFFVNAGFGILLLVHGTFVVSNFAAGALSSRKRWPSEPNGLAVAVSLLFIAGCLYTLPGNYRLPKQDFPGARDFVESMRSEGDSIASLGLASLPFETYYAPHWDTVETQEELDALNRRPGATWLVYSFPKHTRAKYPEVVAYLESQFERVKTFAGTLNEGEIIVYRSRESATAGKAGQTGSPANRSAAVDRHIRLSLEMKAAAALARPARS